MPVGRSGDVLMLECTTNYLHQLTEFAQLVATETVVHNKAFHQVLLEDAVGPLTELDASLTLYTIANGDDNVEVIKRYRFLYPNNV